MLVSGSIIKEVNLRAAVLLRSSRFSRVFVSYRSWRIFYYYHFISGGGLFSRKSPGIMMNA